MLKDNKLPRLPLGLFVNGDYSQLRELHLPSSISCGLFYTDRVTKKVFQRNVGNRNLQSRYGSSLICEESINC